jgi:hypothetical protein
MSWRIGHRFAEKGHAPKVNRARRIPLEWDVLGIIDLRAAGRNTAQGSW